MADSYTPSSGEVVDSLAPSVSDTTLAIIEDLITGDSTAAVVVLEDVPTTTDIAGQDVVFVNLVAPAEGGPVAVDLSSLSPSEMPKVLAFSGETPVELDLGSGFSGTVVLGDGDNEVVVSGNGAVSIETGAGADSVKSGGGADTVVASGGADSVKSGGGADVVEFAAGFSTGGEGKAVYNLGGGKNEVDIGNLVDDVADATARGNKLSLELGDGSVIDIIGGKTYQIGGEDVSWKDLKKNLDDYFGA